MRDTQTQINGAEYLTKQAAATRIGMCVRTIERAIKRGDLPAGGTPGRVLIRLTDFDEWIRRRNGNSA